MAILTRTQLKAFFETGDKPTEAQFTDLIDSLISMVANEIITGAKTFGEDVTISNDKVIKPASGNSELNLRDAGNDSNISITPDNGGFNEGFLFLTPTTAELGFNATADVSCFNNLIRIGAPGHILNVSNAGIEIGEAPSHKIGFYGATPIVKPTVTGSRAGNAALASLLTELDNLGLITDSTTA